MKIEFADRSFIECKKSDNPGKIIITVASRDHENPLKKTTNSVEITFEEFKRLISDVQIQ